MLCVTVFYRGTLTILDNAQLSNPRVNRSHTTIVHTLQTQAASALCSLIRDSVHLRVGSAKVGSSEQRLGEP